MLPPRTTDWISIGFLWGVGGGAEANFCYMAKPAHFGGPRDRAFCEAVVWRTALTQSSVAECRAPVSQMRTRAAPAT